MCLDTNKLEIHPIGIETFYLRNNTYDAPLRVPKKSYLNQDGENALKQRHAKI